MIAIIHLEQGISSKRGSSSRIDYVPALCTHRPSLLPIECQDELDGTGDLSPAKFCESCYLEEGKVVTRFP